MRFKYAWIQVLKRIEIYGKHFAFDWLKFDKTHDKKFINITKILFYSQTKRSSISIWINKIKLFR